MTDDPIAIPQLQRAKRQWRVITVLVFATIFLLLAIQTFLIVAVHKDLRKTQQVADTARRAADAAQANADKALRLATAAQQDAHVAQALLLQNPAEPDRSFLFPTDQMYRLFDLEPLR